MTKLRATIARRLKQAQDNAAMLTTFNEVDMQNIIQMRKDYQDDFQKKYSIKLGFMSFFTKASIVALKNFPAVNAEIEGDEIIYKNYYNINIAVGTEKGFGKKDGSRRTYRIHPNLLPILTQWKAKHTRHFTPHKITWVFPSLTKTVLKLIHVSISPLESKYPIQPA